MVNKEGNLIGSTLTKLRQKMAAKTLKRGREVESERISQGFVWLKKEKTSRQVHPSKVAKLLSEGWKKTKTIK